MHGADDRGRLRTGLTRLTRSSIAMWAAAAPAVSARAWPSRHSPTDPASGISTICEAPWSCSGMETRAAPRGGRRPGRRIRGGEQGHGRAVGHRRAAAGGGGDLGNMHDVPSSAYGVMRRAEHAGPCSLGPFQRGRQVPGSANDSSTAAACGALSRCGGRVAISGWSRSLKPSLAAPQGEPRASKNSTFARVLSRHSGTAARSHSSSARLPHRLRFPTPSLYE